MSECLCVCAGSNEEIAWRAPDCCTPYAVPAKGSSRRAAPAGTGSRSLGKKDRFGLMVHYETRELRGYRLVVAKGGPKQNRPAAAPSRVGEAASGDLSKQGDVVIRNGMPQFSESAGNGGVDDSRRDYLSRASQPFLSGNVKYVEDENHRLKHMLADLSLDTCHPDNFDRIASWANIAPVFGGRAND